MLFHVDDRFSQKASTHLKRVGNPVWQMGRENRNYLMIVKKEYKEADLDAGSTPARSMWTLSSVGESIWLITRRSGVQIPERPLLQRKGGTK